MTTVFCSVCDVKGSRIMPRCSFPRKLNAGSDWPAVWYAQLPSPDCQQERDFTAPQALTGFAVKEWFLISALDTKIVNGLGEERSDAALS